MKTLLFTLSTNLMIIILLGLEMQQFTQASTTTTNIEKRDVTADDAEIYENAAVAADTVTCSEIGQN